MKLPKLRTTDMHDAATAVMPVESDQYDQQQVEYIKFMMFCVGARWAEKWFNEKLELMEEAKRDEEKESSEASE